jgi:hypothetical protein
MSRSFLYFGVAALASFSIYFFLCVSWNTNSDFAYRISESAFVALVVVAALALIVHHSASSVWYAVGAALIRTVLMIVYWIHCPHLRGITLAFYELIPLLLLYLCVAALRKKPDSSKPALL